MYYRFTTSENKVLFDIHRFTYGDIMINKNDISKYLFSVDKEIAENYIKRYNDKYQKCINESCNKTKDLTNVEELYQDEMNNFVNSLIGEFYTTIDLTNNNVIIEKIE